MCWHFWRKRHVGLETGRIHCERCCLNAAVTKVVDSILELWRVELKDAPELKEWLELWRGSMADAPEFKGYERFETLDQFHASKYGVTNQECPCGAPIIDGQCQRRIAEESGEKYDG